MSCIELRNISKTYNEGQTGEVRALKPTSLTIEAGEMIAVVGPSGSGKSTLLKILGCMLKPTDGEYDFCGEKVHSMNQKELAKIRGTHIGFVFQDFCLLNDRNVEENVMIPLLFTKTSFKKMHKRVHEVLKSVKIDELYKRNPTELSGGQMQRVAIARALVNEPELILADEPTGALDSTTAQEVMDVLIELNRAGKTVIIVTHNPEVAKLCPRKLTIRDGIVEEN